MATHSGNGDCALSWKGELARTGADNKRWGRMFGSSPYTLAKSQQRSLLAQTSVTLHWLGTSVTHRSACVLREWRHHLPVPEISIPRTFLPSCHHRVLLVLPLKYLLLLTVHILSYNYFGSPILGFSTNMSFTQCSDQSV